MASIRQIELFVFLKRDRAYRNSVIIGALMLALCLVINYYAGTYATANVSNQVTDLIVDHVGPYNVDLIFEDGSVLLWIFVAIYLFSHPKYFPVFAKCVSLFTVTRSFFIILTHLAPPHVIVPATGFIFSKFTFGGDLFFSGHTGMPFMMALIFWKNKPMRYLFLFLSVLFGTVALLGHKHYSIDVFAAFFITYSIYHMAHYFFPADFALIDSALPVAHHISDGSR